LQLLGHDVDGGEEAEREVDAAVVVVDRLRQMDDVKPLGRGGELALVHVEEVGGLQRVVAADGDERVDFEIDERVVHVAEAGRLLRVVEIGLGVDALARIGAGGADDDPAAVAQAA
jgi:hypothetical protein